MADSSRVKRYKDLREGIKEEVGINRTTVTEEKVEEDDFLSFMNRDKEEKSNRIEDTITEAKTFEQISKESNADIDKALRSAKSNVGKEEHYNTRVDILNKIRNPEKEIIKIDKMENMSTEQFAKGYFIKDAVTQEEEIEETVNPKKKMTLMERLASMSPKEDVEKVEKALQKEEEIEKEPINIEKLDTIEEEESPSIATQKTSETMLIPKIKETMNEEEKPEELMDTNNHDEKIVRILNYVTIALVIAFMIVCVMIIYQVFF